MAITQFEYTFFRGIKQANIIPPNPHIIELGESNWYGDIPFDKLLGDIERYITNPEKKLLLKNNVQDCMSKCEQPEPDYLALWDISKIFFQVFLDYQSYTAIDLGGSDKALKLDLNNPISLNKQYDLVINMGTAEHIFNVFQVFKTVHDITIPGGHMIHGLPFQGWVDHGFFNFQGTFYWDLAAANSYKINSAIYCGNTQGTAITLKSREHLLEMQKNEEIQGNSMLYITLTKSDTEQPFKTPMQGYYARTVSEKANDAWQALR